MVLPFFRPGRSNRIWSRPIDHEASWTEMHFFAVVKKAVDDDFLPNHFIQVFYTAANQRKGGRNEEVRDKEREKMRGRERRRRRRRRKKERANESIMRKRGGAVANRLRRRTSDQTVLGSNPAVAAVLSPWTRLFTPIVPRRSLRISFY